MEDLLRHLILPQGSVHASFTTTTTTPAPAPAHQTAVGSQHSCQPPNVHPTVLHYLLSNSSQAASVPVAPQSGAPPAASDPRRASCLPQPPNNASSTAEGSAVPDVIATRPVPVGPKQSSDTSRWICSFWYHFGSCRNDPNSADYSGSGKVCKLVHHLGPGTEGLKVQKVPWQWHRNACGLERCEQRAGKEDSSARVRALKSGQDSNGVQSCSVAATPVPALQQSGRSDCVPVPQAQGQNGDAGTAREGNTTRQSKKRKRSNARRGQSAAKPMPPVIATRAKLPTKSISKAVQANAQETCFFWYHGTCKRGEKCPMLHTLTNPPSFVQPPPDYMHYIPCGLEWCPGDHKFEHEQQGHQSQQKGHAKRLCLADGAKGSVQEDVNRTDAVRRRCKDGTSNSKQEWFLAGFP